jgi:hypothetical protein
MMCFHLLKQEHSHGWMFRPANEPHVGGERLRRTLNAVLNHAAVTLPSLATID